MINQETTPDQQREWIERTLFDIHSGDSTPEQTNTLHELLMQSKEARAIYLQSNLLDNQLNHPHLFKQTDVKLTKKILSVPSFWKKPKFSHIACTFIGSGVAAALVMMLKTTNNPNPDDSITAQAITDQPVALLQSNYNANISGNAATGKTTFDKGRLNLDQGIAQLEFRNGAQIVLDGKCGFEILNDKTVVLNHGKMWTYCPPEAHGFTVLTPSGRKIIDLGTEFGIEITLDGQTDLHVLNGLVDIVSSNNESKLVDGGKSVHWKAANDSLQLNQANFNKFVTSNDLKQKRLDAHHAAMLKRKDLLLYYDFFSKSGKTIRNKAPRSEALLCDGTILGGTRVSGRSRQARALQLEHPDDGIRLKIKRPENITNYTIAMWIKMDRMEHALAALFNSDGWLPGSTHFQINQSGGLQAGIHSGTAFHSNSSVITNGQWHFVAVSWHLDTGKAHLYCDGKKLPVRNAKNGTEQGPLTRSDWGHCQLGSWKAPLHQAKRDFKGRIDEFMIFDHALTGDEIKRLYASGRP